MSGANTVQFRPNICIMNQKSKDKDSRICISNLFKMPAVQNCFFDVTDNN